MEDKEAGLSVKLQEIKLSKEEMERMTKFQAENN